MKVVTRGQMLAWLDRLASENSLIAPRRVDGVLLYHRVRAASEMTLPEEPAWRPLMSAKEAFFPPTETLFRIEKVAVPGNGGSRQVRLTEVAPEGGQVVFGVRPCDARGMRVLDALFLESDPKDPYYARRRAQTTLIGLACREMGPTCFCKSVGGAPDESADVDLMLTETDKGYAVQVITEKGRAASAGLSLQDIEAALPRPGINESIPMPDPLAWPPRFQDDYWATASERCLSCRICAYVCPTCRCYAVKDEPLPGDASGARFERLRCWDSCAGLPYRRIAGGHNPRPEEGQRLRNRYYCKFYYYPEQYGPSACTGCGRCIDSCPVGMDITEVLAHLVTG